MPKRKNPYATIESHRAFCEQREYEMTDVQYYDDGTATFDLDSYGELIELHYKLSPEGYWRFDCAYIHANVTADKINTWKAISDTIDSIYQDAAERYWDRRNEDFYGRPQPQPSDKPNDPLDRLLAEKGEW